MSDFSGIYRGVVVNNDDPDYSYRVICQIPQVLGDALSNWCEPILPTIYTPRVGDVVYVQFADNDPTQPLYQSRVHVTKEMADSDIGNGGTVTIADFSITPTKMNNRLHYLF